jgi:N-acetylmuramoyl-L-alanine amidase
LKSKGFQGFESLPLRFQPYEPADHAPVGTRATTARNAGCDVLISLHLNDFDDDSANGLEVLFRDTEDKALAQKLQEALVKVTKMRDRRRRA